MNSLLIPSERREFGRRESSMHAMARMPNRQPQPCVVRNLSDGGALLEFPVDLDPPSRFRLVIEPKDIDTACEVRHRKGRLIGVSFIEAEESHFGRREPVASTALPDWAPEPGPEPEPVLRRRPMLRVCGRELRQSMFGADA